MFAISVVFEIDPARAEDFLAAARLHAANSRAEAGCLAFDIFRDPDRPERFYFHECYRDRAAAENEHRKAPSFAEFGAKTKDWIRTKDLAVWDGV